MQLVRDTSWPQHVNKAVRYGDEHSPYPPYLVLSNGDQQIDTVKLLNQLIKGEQVVRVFDYIIY